jgi:hypothetical protein
VDINVNDYEYTSLDSGQEMSIINDGNGENKRAKIFDPQIKSRRLWR